MSFRNYQLPQWHQNHIGEKLTVGEWLHVIANHYASEFPEHKHGRPSKLTKEFAIKLFGDYVNLGYMTYALDKLEINRSTLWRWKRKFRLVRDMYAFVTFFNRYEKYKMPHKWREQRRMQLRVLQRKRGTLSSLRDYCKGRPSRYSSTMNRKVQSTMQETADKFGVSKRTVINWVHQHPEFRKTVLLKRLEWQLPMFEKQIEGLNEQVDKRGEPDE
ncbi:MAG: hypothetical protein HQ557_15480 [Bacteroidetes bacterium]|nr:hypothetical protein [Bacteroidota bacterium]